ncbi:hypothetical protein BDW02DRAFT_165739 [Decorospora gaudefroyi]|uniref:Uncharacterized protein n=1 Tax=Decorospora gaudefroyi TaxID=184978 RepID=A0A6A5K024_9PLEO|nr:hypothetical protein BDW02DRAFT_165739 [Decorospora gaudefroyi]
MMPCACTEHWRNKPHCVRIPSARARGGGKIAAGCIGGPPTEADAFFHHNPNRTQDTQVHSAFRAGVSRESEWPVTCWCDVMAQAKARPKGPLNRPQNMAARIRHGLLGATLEPKKGDACLATVDSARPSTPAASSSLLLADLQVANHHRPALLPFEYLSSCAPSVIASLISLFFCFVFS